MGYQHATELSVDDGTSCGSSDEHRGPARLHLGANAQPGGRPRRIGGTPGIAAKRWCELCSSRGTAPSSAVV
jgi:hypothetical protein